MSVEESLRSLNRSLCTALADMTTRAGAAEKRCRDIVKTVDEAEKLLVDLLLRTGPDRMGLQDRRVVIQATERLRRIKKET